MTDHLSKRLLTSAFLVVALAAGCSHSRSTPEDVIPVSDQALITLIGKQITIRGKFSLWGKVDPYVVLDNQQVVYLSPGRSFEWGKPYTEMEGKFVSATGILRLYHEPPRTQQNGEPSPTLVIIFTLRWIPLKSGLLTSNQG